MSSQRIETSAAGPSVTCFRQLKTETATFIVWDADSKHGVIIDSAVDYDPIKCKVTYQHNELVAAFVKQAGLTIDYLLETHVHAGVFRFFPISFFFVGHLFS